MKAYTYEMGGNGKGKEQRNPGNLKEQAQEAHERLVELVAEGDDKLMEKFFEAGTLGEEDLVPALHNAIREDKIFPVIFQFRLGQHRRRPDHGLHHRLHTPAPSEHEWVQGEVAAGGNADAPKRHETDEEPVSIYVFKTVSDAFAGRISFLLQSLLGVSKNDATLQNFSKGTSEKLSHISVTQGKTAIPVNELHAGDIGAVAKLKDTLTGDTLVDKGAPDQLIHAVKIARAADCLRHSAEVPRNDEDKLGTRPAQDSWKKIALLRLSATPDEGGD